MNFPYTVFVFVFCFLGVGGEPYLAVLKGYSWQDVDDNMGC